MSKACTLQIQPLGVTLTLAEGQSLLEAARAAGLALRSACRNGTCRECMARVLAGRVHHRIAWPGLSAEEKAEGWVLPCVAVADSDVVLLQPRFDAPR
jgi:ferredoxin